MVRSLPLEGRRNFIALVLRTDFGDVQAWSEVRDLLLAPWGDDYEASVLFVDDPSWAGAGVDEVINACREDEYSSVVFIADAVTMASPDHALLAVKPGAREFRTVPVGVHWIEVNLSIANMDFAEYGHAASEDSDGVFRGFDGVPLT